MLAPAKVNLHLRVGPPRADGFHPLLTWMCTASLFDTLTIETSARLGETACALMVFDGLFELPVEEARNVYESAIPALMRRSTSAA